MRYIYYYETSIGRVGIESIDDKISGVYMNNYQPKIDIPIKETEIIKNAHNQLCEYLNGTRKDFNLEYSYSSTPFRESVWRELEKIPYGDTKSYKDIATLLDNPKAYRAVGNANGKNPIAIFIPCHRVIAHNDKLGGYSLGLDLKVKLLELEKENRN